MKNAIKIPILNDEWSVIVTWGKPEEIAKVMKGWGYPKEDVQSSMLDRRGVCYYHKGCHPVIALPGKPKTPQEIGTLAHEAVHAVEDVFIKIQQSAEGEIFAHSVGAVVRKTLEALK